MARLGSPAVIGSGITGATFGIVGAGCICAAMAARSKAFGKMKRTAYLLNPEIYN